MKLRLFATSVFFAAIAFGPASALTINVPGTSDIWLAGMPDGSTASSGDVAPTHSPVEVPGFALDAGDVLTFSATGLVAHGPGQLLVGPDGNPDLIFNHFAGAENGISDIVAPINALLGVFLSDDQPDNNTAPGFLDFATPLSRDLPSVMPVLQQVFFIGDGQTTLQDTQEFLVPNGATRLFLGTHDGFGWFNNSGSFDVTIDGPLADIGDPSAVPLPAGALLLLSSLVGFAVARRKS